MNIPSEPNDSYYSIKYSHTYVIFLNTGFLDQKQIKWLKNELSLAQQYYWIIVVGLASLDHINYHANFTEIFMEHHTDMYIYYGENYCSYSIKYPLTGHAHTHFQDSSNLLLIQQGPSSTDKSYSLSSNSSIFTTKQAGYGILNPKYSTLIWQEFSSDNHRVINEIIQNRIDLNPREDEEVKNFKIIFVLTFLIFLSAFVQVCIQKELEKRRLKSTRPSENGIIEF